MMRPSLSIRKDSLAKAVEQLERGLATGALAPRRRPTQLQAASDMRHDQPGPVHDVAVGMFLL